MKWRKANSHKSFASMSGVCWQGDRSSDCVTLAVLFAYRKCYLWKNKHGQDKPVVHGQGYAGLGEEQSPRVRCLWAQVSACSAGKFRA